MPVNKIIYRIYFILLFANICNVFNLDTLFTLFIFYGAKVVVKFFFKVSLLDYFGTSGMRTWVCFAALTHVH